MENPSDVNGSSSPVVSEDLNTQEGLPVAPVVTTSQPTPGSQTPESNLLAALREERAKRKEAEDKLLTFNTTTPSDEVYSDEGKLLNDKISSLEAKLESLEYEKTIAQVHSKFPALKELGAEFDEFSKEYPRHKLENVAKLFLTEKGLLDVPRKGLEKPTGGPRVPITSEMSTEEKENLRKNNYGKYRELLKKGII